LTGDQNKIRDFNREVAFLAGVCRNCSKEEGEKEEEEEEVKIPEKVRQTLLREFRVYNLMYRIFFDLIRNLDQRIKSLSSRKLNIWFI